jgi:hypothetical protein
MCGSTSDVKQSSGSNCNCGCCCDSGSSTGFRRRFWTKEERQECLEAYKTQLTKELSALDACIKEGCC